MGVKNNLVVTDYYWFTRFSGLFGINSALPEVPIRIKKRNHKDQGSDFCCIDHLLWLSSVLLKVNCNIYELHRFHRSSPQTTPWNLSKKVIDLNGWRIVIIA